MSYGGIAASGLGGLLVGGARRTPEELRAYQLALYPYKVSARANLQDHIAAERWAASEAGVQGHHDYENALERDYRQEQKIIGRRRQPKWATDEYNYHLYERRPRAPRPPMSAQQKRDMADARAAKADYRASHHVPKVINPATGRAVYADSKVGQSIGSVPASRIQRMVRQHQGARARHHGDAMGMSSSALQIDYPVNLERVRFARGMHPHSRANLRSPSVERVWMQHMGDLADEEELARRQARGLGWV